MKLAIFSPHLSLGGDVAGHIIASYNMMKSLKNIMGDSCQIFTYNGVGKALKGSPKDLDVTYLNYRYMTQAVNTIKEFNPDFIIIAPAGSHFDMKNADNYFAWEAMFKIGVPYKIFMNAEPELEMYPIYRYSLDDPMFKGVIVAEKSMMDTMVDFFGPTLTERFTPYYYRTYQLDTYDNDDRLPKVVSTSRPVTYGKLVENLFKITHQLTEQHGMQVQVAGAHIKNPEFLRMEEEFTGVTGVTITGLFSKEELPEILGNAKFHWYMDPPYKTGLLTKYGKRLPNSVVEAILYGCVPILSDTYALSDFKHKENALIYPGVDWDESEVINDIVYYNEHEDERMKLVSNARQLMKDTLEPETNTFNLIRYLGSLLR